MPTQKLTNEVILAAIEGFEAQKRRIDGSIAELRHMLDGAEPKPAASAGHKGRPRLSAAARARIAEAQRRRWAESRKQTEQPEEPPKPKRRLSPAGRKRIIEATKRRWALQRAAAEKAAEGAKTGAKRSAPK